MVAFIMAGLACGDDGETGGEGELGAQCGDTTCAASEYCCDPDCGVCVDAMVACSEMCPGE